MASDMNYKQIEKDVFNELNAIRTNPCSYVSKLQKLKTYINGKIIHPPNEHIIEIEEGIKAVDNAIEFLNKQTALNELTYNDNLHTVAINHAKDIGQRGVNSHEGVNGINLSDRIEKVIEWDGSIAESLVFCYKTAENIVMSIVIDDGDVNRNQRDVLFNKNFQYVGIGCGKHKVSKYCTVIVYAEGLHYKGEDMKNVEEVYEDKVVTKKKENELFNRKVNVLQENDEDAPYNAISVKIVEKIVSVGGELRPVKHKTYLLDNGKHHIVEVIRKE
jgi:uncharacterized protein YkwD